MTIGTPVSLGNHTITSASSSIALSSSAYTSGDLIVVFVATGSNAAVTVTGVSDGNSFTKANAKNDGNHENVELWYRANVGASSTPTITATFNTSLGGTAPSGVICAVRVPKASSSPLDVAPAGQSTTTTNPTTATGTLSQADEVIFGCNMNDIQGGTGGPDPVLTQASGFTHILDTYPNDNAHTFDYKVVSATTTVSYSPVWDTSGPNVTIVASFKGAALGRSQGYVF